ncbi:MAG: hypothetical protein CVT95_04960 [Bacteroidetes bacterium HGW-Bacteroidetes-12]|nr:MAG: hypothetical protein CVT95_04960 [Bacteroidetes bacterium HGW-Bacteroidetes-12]
MKSLQLIILLLSLFFLSQISFAQDDFYNNSKKQKSTITVKDSSKQNSSIITIVNDSLSTNVFDEHSYLTEDEFHKLTDKENNENSNYNYSENEVIIDEHHRKTRNNQIAGEIVAEIIYNVAITFLIIWGSR